MVTRKISMFEHTCLRCGHVWPSELARPKSCAKCHSPYWHLPRQR